MFGKLLKLQFLSFKQMFMNKNKEFSKGKAILMTVLYGYLAVVFFFVFGAMFLSLCTPYHEAGVDWLYFAFTVLVAVMISVFGSSFMTMNQLYLAKDNELLLSMPIPPKYIMLARMGAIVIMNAALSAFVFIPSGIIRLAFIGGSVWGAAAFILGYFFTVMFSVTLCCLIGYLLALITSKTKKKNLLSLIFSVAFLVIYFSVYTKIGEYISLLADNGERVAGAIKYWILPFFCFGKGMENPILFIAFALLCAALFGICCLLISRSFIKIVTSKASEIDASGKKAEIKISTPSGSMVKKELLKLKSSSIYMMNSCITVLLLPIALIFAIIKMPALAPALSEIGLSAKVIYPAAVCVICTINGISLISACSLSLEGKSLWILKTLPVAPGELLLSKAKAHFAVCAPMPVLCALVLIPFVSPDLLSVLFGLILILLSCALDALFGTFINLMLPSFDWQNEAQPIKQSSATLIGMLRGMIGGVIMVITVIALDLILPVWLPLLVFCVILFAADIILYLYIKNKSARRFYAL